MKGKQCFVDTGAFVALNDGRNQHYRHARDIAAKIKDCQFVISDAVITETYSLMRYRLGFDPAYQFLKTIFNNKRFHIAEITIDVRKSTADLLNQFHDQRISYCDAMSVAIMHTYGIEKIFSFDHHFEMMGMTRIQ